MGVDSTLTSVLYLFDEYQLPTDLSQSKRSACGDVHHLKIDNLVFARRMTLGKCVMSTRVWEWKESHPNSYRHA